MPCIPCGNGKYKYGHKGDCVFPDKGSCEAARMAIHAKEGHEAMKRHRKKHGKHKK